MKEGQTHSRAPLPSCFIKLKERKGRRKEKERERERKERREEERKEEE